MPGGADDYVGVALADALTTELHTLKTVSVRRMGAGTPLSGAAADPIAAGRELGVDLIMDGAIQRQGDRLRVTVHLARVADAVTLWSQHFDSAWNDVFQVQDQIAEQVTRALAVTLTGDERRRLNRRRTASLDAYEAYLKGRYFWNERNVQSLHRALEYFQQAIAKDPNYASAYAGLADTYAMLGSMPYADLPDAEAGPKAKAAATKALEIDETLAEAHVSLAFITYAFEWDWAQGEREFKRAIELDPEYATAHYWYALYLNQLGRTDEAAVQAQQAVDLEPLSLVGTYSVGLVHYFARRFDLARRYADKTLEISPQFLLGRRLRGMVDIAQGRYAEAIEGLGALYKAQPDSSLSAGLLAYAYGRAGKRDNAHAVLDAHIATSRDRFVSPANIALGYVGTDETDTALRWLEMAYAQRSQALTFLKTDPLYDRIRSDPRDGRSDRARGLSGNGRASAFGGRAAGQLAIEPALRHRPFAFDGRGRDAEHGGGFLDREPAEEAQLHDAGLDLVELFQSLQCLIERQRIDDVDRRLGRHRLRVLERHVHRAAAALVPQLAARVIDEDAPHHLRGDGEEMSAILPVDVALIEQLHVRLVDDGRGLQASLAPLARELPRRERAQLAMDERDQPLEGFATAVAPRMQYLSDFRGCRDRIRHEQRTRGQLSTHARCGQKLTTDELAH